MAPPCQRDIDVIEVLFLRHVSCIPGVKESAGGGGGLLPRLSGGGLVGVARQVFLPEGYPESVSGDYLEYQAWDTAQVVA